MPANSRTKTACDQCHRRNIRCLKSTTNNKCNRCNKSSLPCTHQRQTGIRGVATAPPTLSDLQKSTVSPRTAGLDFNGDLALVCNPIPLFHSKTWLLDSNTATGIPKHYEPPFQHASQPSLVLSEAVPEQDPHQMFSTLAQRPTEEESPSSEILRPARNSATMYCRQLEEGRETPMEPGESFCGYVDGSGDDGNLPPESHEGGMGIPPDGVRIPASVASHPFYCFCTEQESILKVFPLCFHPGMYH